MLCKCCAPLQPLLHFLLASYEHHLAPLWFQPSTDLSESLLTHDPEHLLRSSPPLHLVGRTENTEVTSLGHISCHRLYVSLYTAFEPSAFTSANLSDFPLIPAHRHRPPPPGTLCSKTGIWTGPAVFGLCRWHESPKIWQCLYACPHLPEIFCSLKPNPIISLDLKQGSNYNTEKWSSIFIPKFVKLKFHIIYSDATGFSKLGI